MSKENQARLGDLLRRYPTTENFIRVYTIVERLLDRERGIQRTSTSASTSNPFIDYFCKQLAPSSTILEIGSSHGHLSEHLARKGHRIVGIDSAREGVEEATARLAGTEFEDRCHFEVRDCRELGDFTTEHFDYALSTEVIEHLGLAGAASHLEQVYRLLKKNGRYFLTCPSAAICGVEGDLHLRMYYFHELCSLAGLIGFETRLYYKLFGRHHVLIPAWLNALVGAYERLLVLTRLNTLFNRFGLLRLCLPMQVVLTKRMSAQELQDRRTYLHALRERGLYRV